MCELNGAVQAIVTHKGNLIKNKDDGYIRSVLREHGIISNEDRKETVNNLVKAFKMGAVDAMVFDVGAALDLPEFKRRQKRRRILEKIFAKK